MKIRVTLGAVLLVLAAFTPAYCQENAIRDARAIAILQRALSAMGPIIPSDLVATGSVTIVEGSKTSTGSIRILTRGTEQSLEQIATEDSSRKIITSGMVASETDGSTSKSHSLERAASSQSACIPALIILRALNDPESEFEYVGEELLDGVSVLHVRFRKTFASNSKLQHLKAFSEKDVWVDAQSGLPRKIFYEQRNGGGASDRTRMEFVFSDYQANGGAVIPRHVEKFKNGTLWMTITVSDVSFNNRLADTDFPVVLRRPQ